MSAIGYDYTDVVLSDEKGRYLFDDFEFPDSTGYQLLAYTNEKTKDIEIRADADVWPPVTVPYLYDTDNSADAFESRQTNNFFSDYVLKATHKYVMENGMRQIDLPEVTVKARKKETVKRLDNNAPFQIKPDSWISPENIEGDPPVNFEQLFWRIPGVQDVSCTEGVTLRGGQAKIILNGLERKYEDLEQVVHISEIAQVDVYVDAMVKAFWRSNYPVILLTTWPLGYNTEEKKVTNIRNIVPLGYQTPYEFYSPIYDSPETLNNENPDLRSTIYWKPDVVVNKAHKVSVDFYTADNNSDSGRKKHKI
jgi:hypothetical protein